MESPSAATDVVLVHLGGCRYAVPLPSVVEVGRPPGLTRVPGVPGFVRGVANWRGRVLAVLDLRDLLSAGPQPSDRRSRLVVVQSASRADAARVGLLVDAVTGGVSYDAQALEPPLPHLPGAGRALLAGQVTDADGPYGVLDLAAVLALAEQLPHAARRAG
jgi:chemotaxis signal transduction protein